MKLRTLRNLSRRKLRGQRVLLRLDLNAPIVKGKLESADLWKLKSSVLTIEYLRHHGARVIIVSHLGRPNGVMRKQAGDSAMILAANRRLS
jgi:phosphoglycerate kinase